MTKEKLPGFGAHYWELEKSHTNGCYDSMGLCRQYKQRTGESDDSWTVRLYGSHSDLSFTGAWHNNQGTKFYDQWKAGDHIGMLYNASQGTLSYFVNGKYIGTPFKNVLPDCYFIVEGCHLGSFEKVSKTELPEEDELAKAMECIAIEKS